MAEPAPSLSAADKARIRRERREARILAGGTSRLDKITNTATDGEATFVREHQPTVAQLVNSSTSATSTAADTSSAFSAPAVYDDPPDVLPDSIFTSPLRRASTGENPILKFLAGRQQPTTPGAESPAADAAFQDFFSQAIAGNASGDMNLERLMQMAGMEGAAAGASGAAGGNGAPASSSSAAGATASASGPDRSSLWRTLHYFSVLGLGLYAAIVLGVRGSQLSRIESTGAAGAANSRIMWYFATIELMLQSSRFLIEKGRSPSKSIFTKIAFYVPPPYSSYLILAARYTHILTNLASDFSLLLFILGIAAWYRGLE
ncbi:hypothetical protein BZA70DRAFT_271413 [Myxozyma melibiosi]|uniref:Golgi to ER traffic protein 2 n=1 Tax=Myxozyma melibiosi TaxID=54550 RepID=A0ABR1FCA1_9ASCO